MERRAFQIVQRTCACLRLELVCLHQEKANSTVLPYLLKHKTHTTLFCSCDESAPGRGDQIDEVVQGRVAWSCDD